MHTDKLALTKTVQVIIDNE